MKIRLAKKIMACDFRRVIEQCSTWDKGNRAFDKLLKKSPYWYLRHCRYRPLDILQENRKKKIGRFYTSRPPHHKGDKINKKVVVYEYRIFIS